MIGLGQDLGSITAGKLADLVVLNSNPLDDIRSSADIEFVMKGGALYEGDTLNQVWPEQRELPDQWWWHLSPGRHWRSKIAGYYKPDPHKRQTCLTKPLSLL
jgi:cytosine/adenosine deaminase-related metal-dependent hydrolase